MMALACAGPIPGRSSSAAASAVLRLTFSDLAFGSDGARLILALGLGGGGFTHVNLRANGGDHPRRDARLGEVVDFGVRPAGDDLLGGGRAHARKLFELFSGRFVEVDGRAAAFSLAVVFFCGAVCASIATPVSRTRGHHGNDRELHKDRTFHPTFRTSARDYPGFRRVANCSVGSAIACESADGHLSQPKDARTVRRLDHRNGFCAPTLTPRASPSWRLVARRMARSGVVNFRQTKQTQHSALQPVQLSREDHSRSPPNLQRVPLHILKQVD